MSSSTEEWAKITRGCAEIISESDLRDKLEQGRPLRIKLGVDPTAPDLHLGHLVVLKKLRTFQDLGHEVDFIIGDFTAQIGDPSGQSALRPALLPEQVQEHARTYQEQVFKVLDRSRTRVHFNSEWLNDLGMRGLLNLMRRTSVAQMLERADFSERYSGGKPISLLEMVYPVLQGYDSAAVRADLELGGTDQKFNLLMGREMQGEYRQEPQVVMMMPLLEGTDGVRKMSKSYGNFIAFNDTAKDQFGKIMSIPDALLRKYLELLTDLDVGTTLKLHPKEAKVLLGRTIVAAFHGPAAAEKVSGEFDRVFSKKEAPSDVLEYVVTPGAHSLVDILVATQMAPSRNEARRLLAQGAVEAAGKAIGEKQTVIEFHEPLLIQVGKRRFIRVVPK